MNVTMNPLATILRAQRLGLNLRTLGNTARNKARYFHTDMDGYARFNYYMALGAMCHAVAKGR